MKQLILPVTLLALLVAGTIRAATLPTGEIIEAVPVPGAATQSYAAYLPRAFRPDRRWPIVYVFDPAARGKLAVGLFVPAAERHGWIVVASNNARNGPRAPLWAAVEAVWNDTRARFPIAARRVYFAGMSGGTGPAWDLGKEYGAGVISCGGPRRTDRETFEGLRFALYALAGDGDFNYGPMREMALRVLKEGGEARFDVFSGGHGWAPADALGRAADWMELLATRDGLAVRDDAFVHELFEETLARARAMEATNAYHAGLLYRSMERDFAGLVPVDDVSASAKRVDASKAARKAKRSEMRLIRKGEAAWARLAGLRLAITARTEVGAISDPSRGTEGSGWESLGFVDPRRTLLEELDEHRGRMQREARTDDVLLSQRTFESARVGFMERARQEMQEAKWNEAVVDLDLVVAMQPGRASLRVELARALVGAKENRRALSALREAVSRGYRDLDLLRNDEAFAPLRRGREWDALLSAAGAAGSSEN